MKIKAVKLKVDASSLREINLEGVIAHIAPKVEAAFRDDIGPHYVDAAKARAPVSEDRDFNPQKSSFKPLKLKKLGSFGAVKTGNRAERLSDLSGMTAKQRANALRSQDIEFFEGTGANKGKTPDAIDIIGGSIKGAFKHPPGTLRDSIHVESVTREGNKVVLKVTASAPYALAVHEGFTHRGGRGHTGKETHIKEQKFLESPLVNVRDRLKNPATYTGK